ncbi:MAG: porin [Methylocystis sp.]|jgi:phosphate-selective porin OprO/OprP
MRGDYRLSGARRRKAFDAKAVALTAGALALCGASSAWAGDISAEIRLLRERLDATDAEVRTLKKALRRYEGGQKTRERGEAVAREKARPGVAREARRPENSGEQQLAKAREKPPLPFFISLSRGLMVESLDHENSLKIGGRVYLDGGISTQPEQGLASIANIRQARLEVEGKLLNYWLYKLQYEFAAGNTKNVGAVGGVRDAYVALTYFDPITLQVGNFYEPLGLEWTNSRNSTDFLERAMVFTGPLRHVGFAALTHGSNWSLKAGVFTTGLAEKSLQPDPSTPVPWGVLSKAGWVATGGSQYVDVAGRATYAPVWVEDRLLHFGVSGRYHQPNDSTATNDGALAPGGGIKTESNILNENLLGAPDLSCGAVAFAGNPPVAGKCVRDAVVYAVEAAAAYGPLSLQGEYVGTHYARNNAAILAANASGNYAPGGASVGFNGYYVYGTWYLTGESRAAAYQVDGLNPATFRQIGIKHPLSAGGVGAWELAARFSAANLDSGPYSGSYYSNLLAAAQGNAPASALVANSGVVGGREEDITMGLNWYPDQGFRVMANWTRVMHLSAPWDRPYLNGAHPNTFLIRTQVNW